MRNTASAWPLWAPISFVLVCFSALSAAAQPATAKKQPHVVIETSMGEIEVALFAEKAPVSVENFLSYVRSGHYEKTLFHRVIKDFMIQGGGYNLEHARKPTKDPIKNEADNGLKNLRGTVAMARTQVIHSATAQFYINTVDNPRLDHVSKTVRGYGYSVFGRVVRGMDVVDKIQGLKVGACPGIAKDCPQQNVVINRIRVVGDTAKSGISPKKRRK